MTEKLRSTILLAVSASLPLLNALAQGTPRNLLILGIIAVISGILALVLPQTFWRRIAHTCFWISLPFMLTWLAGRLGHELPPHVPKAYAALLLVIAIPLVWVPTGPTKNYLMRRMLLIIPTFLGISLITFLIVQLAPGSPVYLKLHSVQNAAGGSLSPEVIEATKKLYGLDKPMPVRYVMWLGKLLVLDFGNSYKDFRPVITRILEALPITLELNLISVFLIYLLSIPLGIYSATHQFSWQDSAMTVLLFILFSLPSFWVAMLLIYFLGGGAHLDWFPIFGMHSPGADDFSWGKWILDRLWHLVLPVFCLSYSGLAYLSRFARAGMLDTVRQDYIRTARAYGFSEGTIIYKYALRNSLIPIITLLGTLLPAMISGSVIIESIFSIPGMGRLSFEAILSRDYPLIMGILSITSMLTLLGLIISDALYALVDPRIRFD